MKTLLAAVIGIFLLTSPVHSHHSNAASFTNIPITIEGSVDKYLFRNPHVIVYVNVVDSETGETVRWMAEGPAATGLRLAGWNDETFKEGEYIRITGNRGRSGRPMVDLKNVFVVDPETGAVIRPIESKRTVVVASDSGHPDFDYPAKKENGLPNLDGIWVQGGDGPNPSFLANADPVFTPAGQAIQDAILALNDPQYVKCEPATLIRQAGFTPHPVRITQADDRVTFEYEEYSGERVVYLDDREYDDFDPDSRYRQGRYKAYYEGDALLIESDLLESGWSSIFGQVISDQATTVETYTREFDPKWGPSVHLSMIITDPVNLAEPWEMAWNKYYTVSGFTGTENDNVQEDYVMLPVDCQIPLTAGTQSDEPMAAPDFASANGAAVATQGESAAQSANAVQSNNDAKGSNLWFYILGALAIVAVLVMALRKK